MTSPRFYRFALVAGALVLPAAVLSLCRPCRAADEKPAAKEEPKATAVGEATRQTLKGMTYLYASDETTLESIGETIRKLRAVVDKAAADGKAETAGPMVLVFHGADNDPKTRFVLDVGLPVKGGVLQVAAGGAKARKLDEFRCVTVLYTGPLSAAMAVGYQKLAEALAGGSMTPTGETRQTYLYVEGPESPNNVIRLEIGIQ